MTDINNYSKSKEVRTLLYVIGAGVLSALVLSLTMLYTYNPEGKYLAGNVILSPEHAFSLSDALKGAKGKGKAAVDHINFSYYDPKARALKKVKVDLEHYTRFYDLVKGEFSILDPASDIQDKFNIGHPAILMFKFTASGQMEPFSEVDFAEGSDYFRVQIRQQGAGMTWAYFYHQGIYDKVLTIMTGQ